MGVGLKSVKDQLNPTFEESEDMAPPPRQPAAPRSFELVELTSSQQSRSMLNVRYANSMQSITDPKQPELPGLGTLHLVQDLNSFNQVRNSRD